MLACLPFPRQVIAAGGSWAGGLPKQLVTGSRIPTVVTGAFGPEIAVRLYDDAGAPPLPNGIELAAVIILVDASSVDIALTSIADTLEAVVLTLSFQMQQAFAIVLLEVLDVTGPLEVGEERQMLLYPFPTGYPLGRFGQSMDLGSMQMAPIPDLSVATPRLERKPRAALDWYIKSLAAPFSTDQFMLLWIALAKLWEASGVRDEIPYTVQRCGHVVTNCPVCNGSTNKVVFGASIKKYMTTQLGLDPKLAGELWGMRQMLHGAKDLDSEEVREIAHLVQVIRACVAVELKGYLGLVANEPPFVSAGMPAVAPQLALAGSRQITEKDIRDSLR